MRSLPEERMFDRNHGWIEMEDEFIGRCGLSEYCLNKLDTIEYIEFLDVDTEVRRGEQVAFLESNVDFHRYTSPVAGRITDLNKNLETNPGEMNRDPYGDGWMLKIDVKELRDFDELMREDEYLAYIQSL